MRLRIGLDVGGTFTDLVLIGGDKTLAVVKTPTIRGDLVAGLLTGIDQLAAEIGTDPADLLGRTDAVVHGTTVATNAVLTETGARTGLVTTRGFRDILAMRRGIREVFYDNKYRAPAPLVPRYLRRTVSERITAAGDILTALDLGEVREACALFKREGIEAVAVCFMHSYKNPTHEKAAAALVRELMPDAFVTASHEILPEIRIYDRISTTVFNAYTGPIVARYLARLDGVLRGRGFAGTLLFMQSNGGVTSPADAARAPAKLVLSGPAAGPAAGVAAAQAIGFKDLAVCDAGGTSFEVSLVHNGAPLILRQQDIDRRRLALPTLGIHTIGAGGGSIAWADSGGLLHVGPKSAGSEPGPACYGRGGTEATVTDAALMLGYLAPEFFLGGRMALFPELAERAVGRLAKRLGLDVTAASRGICEVTATNMAAGIHAVTVERGYDPRDFLMVAGGGAGPLFACRIAEELQMPAILVPGLSAALCAWGMLHADFAHDDVTPLHARLDTVDMSAWSRALQRMRAHGEALLDAEGVAPEDRRFSAAADLRYLGQYDDITVALQPGEWEGGDHASLIERFHRVHDELNGYALPEQRCEVTALRLASVGIVPKPPAPARPRDEGAPNSIGARRIAIDAGHSVVPVYTPTGWGRGHTISGPCIVERPASTLVLLAGFEAGLDRRGNLLAFRKSRREFAARLES